MENGEFSSGTFILPPKADHRGILDAITAVAMRKTNQVHGCKMGAHEANSILTLYHGLDGDMRDRLMARTVPDMLAVTLRCRALSEATDHSWTMYEHTKVG